MNQTVYFPTEDVNQVGGLESVPEIPNLVMEGQMKLRPAVYETPTTHALRGFQAVSYAHNNASVEPDSDNYMNAIQVYPYTPGSLYQVYTAPTQITDIALEAGEGLTSVSAGDTSRWSLGDTVSGAGANEQVHILIKPLAPELSTNAVITTTKRTYYLELKSFRDTYMAAVSWRYPFVNITRRRTPIRNASSELHKTAMSTATIEPDRENLRFSYKIKGDNPDWRPLRVFDDGKKVFIEFPESLAQSEAPPLFVTGYKGKAQLVNYRVKGDYYVVDRLFDKAELRLGEKDQMVVRIERES